MSDQAAGSAGPEVTAPPKTEVELLCDEVAAARQKRLAGAIGKSRNRDRMAFGDIHDCDRRNTYSMIAGDQRPRWNEFVQAKLEAGKHWEILMKRELLDLGYEPKMADQDLEIKDKNGVIVARGFTDLCLERTSTRTRFPCEIKQMQPHMFEKVSRWQDLLLNPWTKKYVRQIMLYMHALGKTEGLFLLGDFQGHWKLIPVYLDQEIVDDVLKKIETANVARVSGKLPDRIPYDHDLCGRCDFQVVCIPDITADPRIKIVDNVVLAKLLEVREANYEAWQKVEKANNAVKKFFEDVKSGAFTIGNFIVTRKESLRTTYSIPDEIKAKFASKTPTYKNEIERFTKTDPDAIMMGPGRRIDIDADDIP